MGTQGSKEQPWIKEQAGVGIQSSSSHPRMEGQRPAGNIGGHFLTGTLKEAGEARKGRPHPATTGTRQRPEGYRVAQEQTGCGRTQAEQNIPCPEPASSKASINRGHRTHLGRTDPTQTAKESGEA